MSTGAARRRAASSPTRSRRRARARRADGSARPPCDRGVTATVAVPIASAIVADRRRYFDLIDAYRTGEVEPFAHYLADVTLRCAREAGVSAQRLAELPEQWARRARPRAGSTAARLLPLLTRHPVVDAGDVVRLTGSSSTAAYTAIDTLVDAEVLRPLTESRRDMVWAAGDVLDEADVMVDRLRG